MIKIDIISGFLGAGKTTLVKSLLHYLEKNNQKTVYIVNEFGEMGIDGDIVDNGSYGVFELANGCICCTLKYDFINTLNTIINDIKPDRIIFEPSGIFVFSEIVKLIEADEFKDICKINKVISVIDVVNYLKYAKKMAPYIYNQIKNSNLLILSKIQLSPECAEEIICDLTVKNPCAKILAIPYSEMDDEIYEEILNGELIDLPKDEPTLVKVKIKGKPQVQKLHSSFSSYSFLLPNEMRLEKLNSLLKAITNDIFGEIVRAKGFIKADEKTYLFNVVLKDFSIEEVKRSDTYRMTVIGNEINTELLMKEFL